MKTDVDEVKRICGYDFGSALPSLEEALQAPGSTVIGGNKALALVGNRCIALAIADKGYSNGLSKRRASRIF